MMQVKRHHMVITVTWLVAIMVSYMFFVDLSVLPSSVSAPTHSPELVHGVVMLAGGKMAQDPMVDLSIQSLRRVGGWEGKIYVLTDRPECFGDTVKDFGISPITVPRGDMDSIVKIKTLKVSHDFPSPSHTMTPPPYRNFVLLHVPQLTMLSKRHNPTNLVAPN
jgi:hypothetical protein